MTDRVGQQLGNYRLLNLIGRGNFAEVYLGEHLHLNTQAAIKVLRTHFTSEDEERFYKEARTIARLTHPHIVRVLDFAVEDGFPFLITTHFEMIRPAEAVAYDVVSARRDLPADFRIAFEGHRCREERRGNPGIIKNAEKTPDTASRSVLVHGLFG